MIKPGLYESILTERLRKLLPLDAVLCDLDDAEAPDLLTGHLAAVIKRALESAETPKERAQLVNDLLRVISAADETIQESHKDAVLTAVLREGEIKPPDSPATSLSRSCLFTGAAGRPQMANELVREMLSADRVDILVSFIKRSGVTLLMKGFEALRNRNIPVRIITTCYMGASDPEAVEALAMFPNVSVRVSYDTKHTRLHAKAYFFYRESGFSTAYVGSSNMSNPAMSEGLEWNIKVTRPDLEHILKGFEAEFEGYWNSESFEPYSKEEPDKAKFRRAIAEIRKDSVDTSATVFFDITPRPYQSRILEALKVERHIRDSWKNLIVAATGTGKTIIAALDYRDYCRASGNRRPRLLFIAHRNEILDQNMAVFRNILKDPDFGERMGGPNDLPGRMDHLFCTIQTADSKRIWDELGKNFYEFIVVDEAHHSPASSYAGIFTGFSPKILLGLTATPERMDGESIRPYFGDRIAAELRLPEALEEKLLCPFQYFGVADPISVEDDRYWQAGKYSIGELERAYVDESGQAKNRAAAVVDALRRYRLGNLAGIKGIGFCVSIRHAEFMAKHFCSAGIPSDALTSRTDDEFRKRSLRGLKDGSLKLLFTVDLFNEGVDIPEMNTALFLRPTDSLTVFLQQLGRGLRHADGKDALLVLDFVGQMHRRYRVDRKFAALLPGKRFNIQKEVEHGFPHVPPGCSIQLEKQALDAVLRNIKASYSNLAAYIPETLKTFKLDTGKEPTFGNYLKVYDVEPERLLKDRTWSQWKSVAGLIPEPKDPDLPVLRAALARACQITAPGYLSDIEALPDRGAQLVRENPAKANMLYSMLWDQKATERGFTTIQSAIERLAENPAILGDLREIAAYRKDITTCGGEIPYELPLELHGHYTNNEIQAAFGRDTFGESTQRGVGVLSFPRTKSYALLVTLNKSDKDFSPTTMYKDYPVNLTSFHWESQSTTTQDSPTGHNLIEHQERGYGIYLFVRVNKSNGPLSAPFQFLGRVAHISHEGDRPISFIWKLEHHMPAELLEASRVGG